MPPVVIAIPVRDEAALIGDCLRALALQQAPVPVEILLLVNNSTDGTADLARDMRPLLPCRLHVIEARFAPHHANAGHARRVAMDHAAVLGGPDSVLLTTDADGCVAPDWLEANLAAIAAGADVVCGRAVIDPLDALRIPQRLHDDDAREVAYGRALDRIAALLDPDPADPWPRHTEDSGASIAVRREVFLAAGGVPDVPSGEDRALVAALRRLDARVRHDPDVIVTVSGRTQGRAAQGMAETIRRRIIRQDPVLDDALEPAHDCVRRMRARGVLRTAWHARHSNATALWPLADRLEIGQGDLETCLDKASFGAAWAALEAASPVLIRRLVKRADLEVEMARAMAVLDQEAAIRPERDGLLF